MDKRLVSGDVERQRLAVYAKRPFRRERFVFQFMSGGDGQLVVFLLTGDDGCLDRRTAVESRACGDGQRNAAIHLQGDVFQRKSLRLIDILHDAVRRLIAERPAAVDLLKVVFERQDVARRDAAEMRVGQWLQRCAADGFDGRKVQQFNGLLAKFGIRQRSRDDGRIAEIGVVETRIVRGAGLDLQADDARLSRERG